MPDGGVVLLSHNDILRYEEIAEIVKVAVAKGIEKVRITGGEPLVRRGITGLVKMLSDIEGIKDLSMTTNGVLLEKYADELFAAGLKRINISLDTVDADTFARLTRGGKIGDVLRGILAAQKAGFHPIKINCVITHSTDEKDAIAVGQFCRENGLEVRYIQMMNLEGGSFSIVHGGSGGDCGRCNRLRLTANGKLIPCLFSNIEYDVKLLGIEKALDLAVQNKPHAGTHNPKNLFHNIGG
jgi:cyclic pyranopterin phosphate synthase